MLPVLSPQTYRFDSCPCLSKFCLPHQLFLAKMFFFSFFIRTGGITDPKHLTIKRLTKVRYLFFSFLDVCKKRNMRARQFRQPSVCIFVLFNQSGSNSEEFSDLEVPQIVPKYSLPACFNHHWFSGPLKGSIPAFDFFLSSKSFFLCWLICKNPRCTLFSWCEPLYTSNQSLLISWLV